MGEHPAYPNPLIQEALCELHFRQKAEGHWTPNKPGALLRLLQEDYPEPETITEQGMQLTIGKDGPVPRMMTRIKLKLQHRSKPVFFQVGDTTFSVHWLNPYRGWNELKGELLAVWPKALDALGPEMITRIGMRYINRIPRQSADEKPGWWLQPSNHSPGALLESGPNFVQRLEVRLDSANRLITTIAHDVSRSEEPFGSVVFDIDRITEREIGIDISSLEETIEALHEDIWNIFAAAKGERLERLLRGRQS